jgi:exoribonuclease R
MTKFTSATTIGNSSVTDDGTSLRSTIPLFVTGAIRATGDVFAFSSSDERLKENIFVISGSLDKLMQIRGVEFDWKTMTDGQDNVGHDIGVIAQEIQAVLPEIVTTRDNGYLAVKYEKIVALLIESNKELLKRVEALESKIK